MEREVLARTKQKLGLAGVEVLHPSVMNKPFRYFWFEKASVRLLTEHTDYRRLDGRSEAGHDGPERDDETLSGLPKEYVAVRFYFRPSFPDTPDNRRFASGVVRSISRDIPVVLLNTGLNIDDHAISRCRAWQGCVSC